MKIKFIPHYQWLSSLCKDNKDNVSIYLQWEGFHIMSWRVHQKSAIGEKTLVVLHYPVDKDIQWKGFEK